MVDNLQEGLVLHVARHHVNLVFEWDARLVALMNKFILVAHDNDLAVGAHRFLSKVARFVVKETVRVTAPGDSLHQNTAIN